MLYILGCALNFLGYTLKILGYSLVYRQPSDLAHPTVDNEKARIDDLARTIADKVRRL